MAILAAVFFVGFAALGTWQLQRRIWKLDLVSRVQQRVNAAPVPAPPDQYPVSREADEYRHVYVTGVLMHPQQTLVQAVTDLGAGFWVLTPLRRDDGSIVFINRGFVLPDLRGRVVAEPAGKTTLTGLLRINEPGGAFLRHNDPAADRWYSRDVQAMATARQLTNVAPYFIDAESSGQPLAPGVPVGGLTAIRFHNSHLVYAFTWYTLAAMVAAGVILGIRQERRARSAASAAAT